MLTAQHLLSPTDLRKTARLHTVLNFFYTLRYCTTRLKRAVLAEVATLTMPPDALSLRLENAALAVQAKLEAHR